MDIRLKPRKKYSYLLVFVISFFCFLRVALAISPTFLFGGTSGSLYGFADLLITFFSNRTALTLPLLIVFLGFVEKKKIVSLLVLDVFLCTTLVFVAAFFAFLLTCRGDLNFGFGDRSIAPDQVGAGVSIPLSFMFAFSYLLFYFLLRLLIEKTGMVQWLSSLVVILISFFDVGARDAFGFYSAKGLLPSDNTAIYERINGEYSLLFSIIYWVCVIGILVGGLLVLEKIAFQGLRKKGERKRKWKISWVWLAPFLIIVILFLQNIGTHGVGALLTKNPVDSFYLLAINHGFFTSTFVLVGAIIPGLWIFSPSSAFGKKSYLYVLKVSLKTGLSACFAYLIILVTCLVFASKSTPFVGLGLGDAGFLGNLRLSSPIIFVGLFFVHVFLFFGVLSFFSSALSVFVKRKEHIIVLFYGIFFYYLFIPSVNGNEILDKLFSFFFPQDLYAFIGDINILYRLTNLLTLVFVGLFLLDYQIERSKKKVEVP